MKNLAAFLASLIATSGIAAAAPPQKPNIIVLCTEVPKGQDVNDDLPAQQSDRVKSMQAAYEALAKDLPKPLWSNDRPE